MYMDSIKHGIFNNSFMNINESKYFSEDASAIIAMESSDAIHDLFVENVFQPALDEARLIKEGYSPDSESFQAVTENVLKNLLDSIIKILVGIRDKVIAFFKGIGMRLDSIFKTGKEFVQKYRAEIRAAQSNIDSDFEVKMYKYNNKEINDVGKDLWTEISPHITNAISRIKSSDIKDVLEKEDESNESVLKSYRGKLAGTSGSIDDNDEYIKKLYELFRGGEDKEEIKPPISEIVSSLESDATSAKIKKLQDNLSSSYNKGISSIEKEGKSIEKDISDDAKHDFSSLLRKSTEFISRMQDTSNTYFNVWQKVFQQRDSEYKSVLMAAIKYKPKKK